MVVVVCLLYTSYKADGIITKSEYTNEAGADLTTMVSVGDSMTVKVLKVNDGEGLSLIHISCFRISMG